VIWPPARFEHETRRASTIGPGDALQAMLLRPPTALRELAVGDTIATVKRPDVGRFRVGAIDQETLVMDHHVDGH
jgi:hypothetical protein